MNTNFDLPAMSGEDFETCRAAGYAFRRELTHAVMSALHVPDAWDLNGEYRSEYGGLFPVQIRLAPAQGCFEIVLCSPGEVSERWLMLMATRKGQEVSCIRHSDRFDAEVFNHVLSLADSLSRSGYTPGHIVHTLHMEAAR